MERPEPGKHSWIECTKWLCEQVESMKGRIETLGERVGALDDPTGPRKEPEPKYCCNTVEMLVRFGLAHVHPLYPNTNVPGAMVDKQLEISNEKGLVSFKIRCPFCQEQLIGVE